MSPTPREPRPSRLPRKHLGILPGCLWVAVCLTEGRSGHAAVPAVATSAARPAPIGNTRAPETLRLQAAGLTLLVTEHDVQLLQGKLSWSLAAEHQAVFQKALSEWSGDEEVRDCEDETKVQLVSFAPPLLGLRESRMFNCVGKDGAPSSAHPAGGSQLVTYAVRDGAVVAAQVGDWFDNGALRDALLKDPLVRARLAGEKPASLDDLVAFLAHKEAPIDPKHCFEFSEDLLGQFVVHHLEGAQVALRLGLPGAAPCRFNLTQLGVALPVPAPLEASLRKASAGQEGAFFAKSPAKYPEASLGQAKRPVVITLRGKP